MADYVLEIVEGPEAGRMIPLAGPVELGRDAGAGVALQQDELLSRRHVRITPEADGVLVEDLGSRNGTFVDGDQIYSPAHLAVDGQLLVGVTVLQLRTAEPPHRAPRLSGRSPPTSPCCGRYRRSSPTRRRSALSRRRWPFPRRSPTTSRRRRSASGASALFPLLDVHTKGKAKGAPIGIFVLVAFAVIIYFGLR